MLRLILLSHRNYQICTLHVEGACLGKLLGLEKLVALFLGNLGLLEKLGISFAVATGFFALANLNKLHLENQSGIRRDRIPGSTLAIGIFRCQLQLSLLSDGHRCDTNVPPLDDLALSNCKLKWFLMI